MSESLNLCLSCGLCCDGTLIGFVQLETEEIPALKEIMEIEVENDQGFFLQPCKNLNSCSCTIYSKRPKQCDKFNCGLLKSVEQNETDFDSALEVINALKQKKIEIGKKLESLQVELQSQSFYFKMRELKRLLEKKKAESSLSLCDQELIVDLEFFDKLLSQKFGLS